VRPNSGKGRRAFGLWSPRPFDGAERVLLRLRRFLSLEVGLRSRMVLGAVDAGATRLVGAALGRRGVLLRSRKELGMFSFERIRGCARGRTGSSARVEGTDGMERAWLFLVVVERDVWEADCASKTPFDAKTARDERDIDEVVDGEEADKVGEAADVEGASKSIHLRSRRVEKGKKTAAERNSKRVNEVQSNASGCSKSK
jgi:hypothetical protein